MSRTLADAIIYNRFDTVQELVQQGADINEADVYGYPPLVEAAIANHPHIAEFLLKAGAKVNEPDVIGSTALHWAAENNNIAFTKLLLAHGANPNAYTRYGQAVLVKPLLRQQHELKELLYQYGADIKFAQDYIYTKLLAHRFELTGRNHIVDPQGKFIEIDLEGFVLEFSLGVILHSLQQFKNNFAARSLRDHFPLLQKIIDAYGVAAGLIKYQQYQFNRQQHQARITKLLNHQDLLLIPMGCAGHATSFAKYQDLWARCDRGEQSLHEPSVIIYKIHKPHALTHDFLQFLLYEKQQRHFLYEEINDVLGLEKINHLPLSSQITGNCSWANLEGALPTLLTLLLMKTPENAFKNMEELNQFVINLFDQWRTWDKDRALHDMIENFYSASPARKASIAALLANVLFQACHYDQDEDLPRINKILTLFNHAKEYHYILAAYRQVYAEQNKTPEGRNFLELLDLAGNL